MAEYLESAVRLTGWLVATGILLRAWRRFPGRGSRVALIAFLLMGGSGLVQMGAAPVLRMQSMSPMAYGAALSLLGIPGLVGVILVVYAFWITAMRPASGKPSREKGQQSNG